MALTNYTDLQAEITEYLARSDLTARYANWIAAFEAMANRRLRVQQQETVTTLTPSSGSAALPSDYLSWRRVTWTGSPRIELEYVTPNYMNSQYQLDSGSNPNVFTIEGQTLKVRPVNDTPLEFDYFQAIPPLSAGANWLLTDHPDVYVAGTLYEAYKFMVDREGAVFWKLERDTALDEIEKLSNKTRGVGSMHVLGPTP